jgi:TPR repeat protein
VLGAHEQHVRKDPQAALDHYSQGAATGNKQCMHRLAKLLLENGNDPKKNADALEWLRKAADAGDPTAAADLGHRLLTAEPPDHASARRYLTAAGMEKIPEAQYELGLLYLEGKGCTPDPVAAVAWLTEAMKGGDAAVQFHLATLHEEGIGTPVNYANAGVLYTLACNKGHGPAATRIARMADEGLGTEPSIARAWILPPRLCSPTWSRSFPPAKNPRRKKRSPISGP